MTSSTTFECKDLLKFNLVNFDQWTETYNMAFYMSYMARWPEYFQKVENVAGTCVGYIMGKAEGTGDNWHGHVTALSVSPHYRQCGLARKLMKFLEDVSELKKTYFVDLFVRKSNNVAINMYKSLGYIIYRTVLDYYSGDPDEDAYDMRKAMSMDVERKSVIPRDQPVRPEDLE